MLTSGFLALIILGFVLGLRHGIDWDHIAAITDITSSAVTTPETAMELVGAGVGRTGSVAEVRAIAPSHWTRDARAGFFLASMYAVGHATVVVALGLLAIWTSTILPRWVDPIMERIVGVTLVLLGVWIFYSLLRYGRSFRLRSRWMLVFHAIGVGYRTAKSRLTGQPIEHTHQMTQYGPRTAYGIGLIHGIGAETGSQALLLAGVAGTTTALSGSLMLLFFVGGLLVSNSLVAVFSTLGFVSSATKRDVYVVIGILAGVFSLVVGVFFVTGQGTQLPDLQEFLNVLFGHSVMNGG